MASVRPSGLPPGSSEFIVLGLRPVDRVFEELRDRSGGRRDRYFLFGHSAGGQIVHVTCHAFRGPATLPTGRTLR
jgi:hypothetical protein